MISPWDIVALSEPQDLPEAIDDAIPAAIETDCAREYTAVGEEGSGVCVGHFGGGYTGYGTGGCRGGDFEYAGHDGYGGYGHGGGFGAGGYGGYGDSLDGDGDGDGGNGYA
ncbi:MAG: hypothetical protein V3W44_09750 [Dehalococcoidales bacterium]